MVNNKTACFSSWIIAAWCWSIITCLKFEYCEGFTPIKPVNFRRNNNVLHRHPHTSLYTPTSLKSTPAPGSTQQKEEFQLPPPPEDLLILTGDLVALFTYAFLDHFVTALVIADAKGVYTEPDALQIPVWSDVITNNFGGSLLSAITSQQQLAEIGDVATSEMNQALLSQHHYAPCLESFGVSAVLLGTCWLLSGYFNRAFEYKNTISCDPNHAILVAGRTWIFTALMMLGLAVWSDHAFCGCLDTTRELTRADTDFIFDSFSVLVTWSFVASTLLGGLL